MFFLTIPIEHCTRILSRISQGKEKEGIQIGKEEIKLSLFIHSHTIVCAENPKETTIKLLELINESSEVTEYKINIQKSSYSNSNHTYYIYSYISLAIQRFK